MLNHVTEILAKIPLFKDFSPEVLAELSRLVKLNRFAPNSILLEEGKTPSELIIIIHGRVAINWKMRQGSAYEIAGPGTIVGFLDILSQDASSITARAEEDSIVLAITRADLQAFLLEHPREMLLLLNTLASYLHEGGVVLDVIVPAAPHVREMKPRVTTSEEKEAQKATPDTPFYPKQHTCPACNAAFTSLAVKSKYIRLVKTDPDFCPHYETVNPMFYEVVVCPHCGYAYTEETPKLGAREKAILATRLPEIRSPLSFTGERNFDLAVESFRLAILCLEAIGAKNSLLGKMYLKTAWLYRMAGKEAEERVNLEKALTYFEKAYESEQSPDPALELNLLYLLGELNLRLGNDDTAVRWFSQILEHPQRSTNPGIINRTRERWYEIRQRRK